MSRSRSCLSRIVAPFAVALASLVLAAPALAAPRRRTRRLVSTPRVRAHDRFGAHIARRQAARHDVAGRRASPDRAGPLRGAARRSSAAATSSRCPRASRTDEKQAILDDAGYNGTLASAEESAAARAADVAGHVHRSSWRRPSIPCGSRTRRRTGSRPS